MQPIKSAKYRRNLPHLQPENGCFFVTFSLEGAVTRAMMDNYRENYEIAIKRARLAFPDKKEYERKAREIHMEFFEKYDSLLDSSLAGARWLQHPEIAAIVQEGLSYQDGRSCRLLAWCIMPNHVHLVMDDLHDVLYHILQRMKSFTARQANQKLGLTGQRFWRRESFDHLIRDDWSLKDKIRYTLMNPVKAGFCTHWKEWPWSGLHDEMQELIHQ